jgi:hypothetical protein
VGKTESQFWSGTVRPKLSPYGIIKRVENVLEEGFPDTVYAFLGVGGLVELKNVDAWPAREDSPVVIRHYTVEQRRWHREWCAAGGRCAVLIRVCGHGTAYDDNLELVGERTSDEFFLFDAARAAEGIGTWTRREWMRQSLVWSFVRFPAELIVSALTGVDKVLRRP